jgi:putative ABC transport system permease protein
VNTVREHAPSVLVAALSSAFGVCLLQVTGALATVIGSEGRSQSPAVAIFLTTVALVFIAIAVYVGAIVTANTFATIVAGRTRTIALMRLIGATARQQRLAVARDGLTVGIVGALIGVVVGTAASIALIEISVASDLLPRLAYGYLEPVILIPIAAVVLTTWLASWIGSRRVLVVSPMEATGAANARDREEAAGGTARRVLAIVLFALGTGLLVLGMLVGLVSPAGVLVGVAGGILSFSGVVLGAALVMPPALRMVGRMLGRGPTARLAAENAVRNPERAARTTIGLVIGVALITMFVVASASFSRMLELASAEQPAEVQAGTNQLVNVTVTIFSVLIGFSALIAALGLVNTLSLSVIQRTRELGLLRALGFTSGQVRQLIRAESAQLSITAILVGLILGVGYGWAGAQALCGSIDGVPGLVLPVVPVWLLAAVVVAAALLTFAASIAPTRRATRISPIAALAVD